MLAEGGSPGWCPMQGGTWGTSWGGHFGGDWTGDRVGEVGEELVGGRRDQIGQRWMRAVEGDPREGIPSG